MNSKAKEDQPELPDYLSREAKENPVPQLRDLILKKIQDIHTYNNTGIKFLDDQIMHTFDTVLDQKLHSEAASDMKRFKKGRALSKEGIEYKKEISSDDWQQSPTLKLAELIIIKTAGMDALSDEELEDLDHSIQDTYRGIDGIKRQRADFLMKQYFAPGRKLPPMAAAWLKDTEESVIGPGLSIINIIENEQRTIEVETGTTPA